MIEAPPCDLLLRSPGPKPEPERRLSEEPAVLRRSSEALIAEGCRLPAE